LEFFGLCLTDETKYQKAFMFVGPKRGGRGTIGRLLRGLIGTENYAGSTLHSFGEAFGMQSFIGKKLVVFSDARLDGVYRKNLSVITERLLSITGEDVLDINRKHDPYWNGVLRCRIAIFTNELIRFQDESGALAGRFNIWQMKESFWGREDPELTPKLLSERAGIMNLALDALDQLRSRGRLLQPGSGNELVGRLGSLTSDIAAFVEDCCDVEPHAQITCDKLYDLWEGWCIRRGVRHGWGSNQFSEKLCSAIPSLRRSRPRADNPKRLTTLIGIGKRDGLV
jgi:putative DNA primase/helicase